MGIPVRLKKRPGLLVGLKVTRTRSLSFRCMVWSLPQLPRASSTRNSVMVVCGEKAKMHLGGLAHEQVWWWESNKH